MRYWKKLKISKQILCIRWDNDKLINQYIEKIEQNNIVSKTDIDGVITFVSDEFCRISGFSKEELIGKTHNLVRHPDVPDEKFDELWKIILNKGTFKATVKNLSKSGETFYLNTTVFPLLDDNGKILEFVAVRYDVTQAVKAKEELENRDKALALLNSTLEEKVKKQTKELLDLNTNLEKRIKEEVDKSSRREKIMFQQSKLASMGEMIGNIAHQWRQPLNHLNIVLYKMKKEFNKDEKKFNKTYESAKDITKKMSNTIEDFSNFFKPDKKIEHFFVNEVIKQAYSIMKKTLKHEGIVITFDSEGDYKITGYPNEFSHVIVNIINNARDILRQKDGKKLINIKAKFLHDEKLHNCICISVQDNAGGIDKKIINKIFEPYFTTKHQSSGTGIGLYMCKQIIENSMNGYISAENKNEGACFSIKVPCLKECECLI